MLGSVWRTGKVELPVISLNKSLSERGPTLAGPSPRALLMKRMVRTKKLVKEFFSIAELFGPQMGRLLFQFPPSYRYTAARLRSIITQLDPAHRNAVEFRHNDREAHAIENGKLLRRLLTKKIRTWLVGDRHHDET